MTIHNTMTNNKIMGTDDFAMFGSAINKWVSARKDLWPHSEASKEATLNAAAPKVEMTEVPEEYCAKVRLTGVKTVDDLRRLLLGSKESSEATQGTELKSFLVGLPFTKKVEAEKIRAEYKEGYFLVHLPKN